MTMFSGPAAGALAGCEGPPLAGREGLTAARGFAGALAFVSGFGRVTALARAAAGFLGDAATFTGTVESPPPGGFASFPGTVVSAPTGGFEGFPGPVESAPVRGLADFPGTVESPPARGLADVGGGFGDGSDPDGVERFFAIYLSGA